jgi:hypothetical protein
MRTVIFLPAVLATSARRTRRAVQVRQALVSKVWLTDGVVQRTDNAALAHTASAVATQLAPSP